MFRHRHKRDGRRELRRSSDRGGTENERLKAQVREELARQQAFVRAATEVYRRGGDDE